MVGLQERVVMLQKRVVRLQKRVVRLQESLYGWRGHAVATRWPRGHAVGVILQVRRQPSPDRSCQISDYAVVTRSGLSGTRWSRGHAVRVIVAVLISATVTGRDKLSVAVFIFCDGLTYATNGF